MHSGEKILFCECEREFRKEHLEDPHFRMRIFIAKVNYQRDYFHDRSQIFQGGIMHKQLTLNYIEFYFISSSYMTTNVSNYFKSNAENLTIIIFCRNL